MPSLLPTPLALTPKFYENAPGLSAGAIAGICVGAVVAALAAALLFVYYYHRIKKKAIRNVLQIQVSRKVHVETSPGMDTEYGRQYSPVSMSPVGAPQSTTLDVHVVSAAEDVANASPRLLTRRGSFPKPVLKRSERYQPLVVEEADIPDSNSTSVVYTREFEQS